MITYHVFMDAFGSINNLTNKLNYINWMGFDGLLISPPFKSSSYHGYDVEDYMQIDPKWGTNEDMKHLIDKAHSLDVKVILDIPLAHTSNKHKWFLDSRVNKENKHSYYIWSNNMPPKEKWYPTPMNECSWNQDGYTGRWYLSPFCREMPALNIHNWELRMQIRDILHYWLNLGIDGYRLDAILYNDLVYAQATEFARWIRHVCKEVNPNVYLVGEAWDNYEVSKQFTDTLGSSFNFEMQHRLLTNGELIGSDKDAYFLDNHDMDRVCSMLNNDESKLRECLDRLFKIQGDIFIYYGTEIATKGIRNGEDRNVRLPLDWEKVVEQMHDGNSMLHYVRNKIVERRN